MRELVEKHLPAECRKRNTRRHVAKCLYDAALDGDVASAAIALRMVLELEHVLCLRIEAARKTRLHVCNVLCCPGCLRTMSHTCHTPWQWRG